MKMGVFFILEITFQQWYSQLKLQYKLGVDINGVNFALAFETIISSIIPNNNTYII